MSFSNTLIYWYLQNKRDLPWRRTKNPYFIWLSEIILQQTRVDQGLTYYLAFIKTYPSIFDLANADQEAVLKLWQGLGYYSRARNLHETAKHIAENLEGKFPQEYKDLIQLKGVGDYTASAIASICFNSPTAVVDGNVYRVLARYYGIEIPINSSLGIKTFKALAQDLIDKKRPADFNQAIMEFGARQCKPQNPDCQQCPLSSGCVALEKNKIQSLPVKLKKVKVRKRFFNYIVLNSMQNKTLLQKRTKKGIWQNLYEFPLVETTASVTKDALLNSNAFNAIIDFKKDGLVVYNSTPVIHKLSHQHLYVKYWILEVEKSTKNMISWNDFNKYPVPILLHNFVENFKRRA